MHLQMTQRVLVSISFDGQVCSGVSAWLQRASKGKPHVLGYDSCNNCQALCVKCMSMICECFAASGKFAAVLQESQQLLFTIM